MKVVSVLNNKGGVGKTTITANLGAAVALGGKRVLMIDADPQANLTFSFISADHEWDQQYKAAKTLLHFFAPLVEESAEVVSLKSIVIPRNIYGAKFDLISSHLNLMDTDMSLATVLGRCPKTEYARKYLAVYSYFRTAIDAIRDQYDLILIDCPPNFNIVTRNVFAASDCYLVPAKMDYLSTFGLRELTNAKAREFIHDYNNYVKVVGGNARTINPTILGVVATMLELRDGVPISAHQPYINRMKAQGYPIFNTKIRENPMRYGSAPLKSIPVILSQDRDDLTLAIKAELRNLGKEFMEKAGI